MFENGKRKVWAFLISMGVYLVLMLTVIFTKQVNPVNLDSFSLQCAGGIMIISGAFYLGNYGVHKEQSKNLKENKDVENG